MKKRLILLTVVLVLMLSFSVSAFGQWDVTVSENEMDGTRRLFAMSPRVGPTKSMGFPYDDMTALLVVGYNGEESWVYLSFKDSPNLLNETIMDGYDLINTRIKWDETIERTTLIQEWGSRYLHFRDERNIISKIKQSNTVLLELDWYGEGKVYFSFPLDGAVDAINEIYDAF
ncbi:MAG: hypothetical protein PWQ84_1607 [Thermotogaceae bacterium]|nr:hypothetical protein [Thermotogaceae bacterium]